MAALVRKSGQNAGVTAMLDSIDHVNIVVRDLEAMVRFYEAALGLRVSKRVTISGDWIEAVVGLRGVVADVVYLELASGPRIELIKYRAPAGVEPPGLDMPNTLGLRHLAFRVSDVASAEAKLRAAGARVLSKPQTVPDAQVTYAGGVRKHLLYFHDPEGNLLELCEYRAGSGGR